MLPLAALSLLLSPLPSYAGHWVITLDGSTNVPGTTGTGNYTFANSQVTGPGPWAATSHTYFDVSGGSCSLGLPGSLSATATLTWTPDAPGDTSQPPPTVDVLETASAGGAEWMLQPTGVSANASDGFGDSVTSPTAPVYGASSSGKHLYHLTVSPGQMSVKLPARSLSASLTYATAITTSGTNEHMGYSVQPDARSVAITSSIEQTYHKDATTGLPVQNKRSSDNSLAADTIAPDTSGTVSITYLPLYPRSAWATASTYAWSFSSGGSSIDPQSGTFNTILYDVSSPEITYYVQSVKPGSSENVKLKLTDSNDGATASNTYSVMFHAPYEAWKDITLVRHPIAFVQGGVNAAHPDWSYLLTISNPSTLQVTQTVTSAVTLSQTQSGTIGAQQTLTPAAIAAFQLNESITVGKTSTFTYTTENKFTGAAHFVTQFFVAMSYEDRTGTCDIYTTHGFQSNSPWQGRWTSGGTSVAIKERPY